MKVYVVLIKPGEEKSEYQVAGVASSRERAKTILKEVINAINAYSTSTLKIKVKHQIDVVHLDDVPKFMPGIGFRIIFNYSINGYTCIPIDRYFYPEELGIIDYRENNGDDEYLTLVLGNDEQDAYTKGKALIEAHLKAKNLL